VPLRRLFWTPISIGPSHGRQTVWEKIHLGDGASFDAEELEARFADAAPSAGQREPTAAPPPRRPSRRRLLEEGRRRQVWCMLALMPDRPALLDAVASLDADVLEPDKVDLLLLNLPSQAEEAALEGARAAALGGGEAWDVPEDFLLALTAIPEYALRLQVWGFLNSFDAAFRRLAAGESALRAAACCLRGSASLERLLALVLHVGNYLNGGTARGRADGFELGTLVKVAQLRSAGGNTLLDFIVEQMERDSPGVLRDMFAPGNEFDRVECACKHKVGFLQEELSQLVGEAGALLRRLDTSASQQGDPLMRRRALMADRQCRLRELQARLDGWGAEYGELCAWFHAEAALRKATDEFFGVWGAFLADVRRALEKLDKQAASRRRSKRRSSLVRGAAQAAAAAPEG